MEPLRNLYCVGVSTQAALALLMAGVLVHLHRRDGGGHLGWWAAGLVSIALLDVACVLTRFGPIVIDAEPVYTIFTSLLAQTAGYCAAACIAIGAVELARGRPAVGAGFAAALPLVVLILGATTTLSTLDSDESTRRFVRVCILALVQAAAFGAAGVAHLRAPDAPANGRGIAAAAVTLLGVGRLLAIAIYVGGGDEADGGAAAVALLPSLDTLLLAGWGTGLVLLEFGRLRSGLEEARESAQRHASRTRHSKHLETVGRLVGSVAHDYNNLLTALTGYSRLLVRRLPPESREHEFAVEIGEASKRAIELTEQLQAFSRRHLFRPTVLSLNAQLRRFEGVLSRFLGDGITLRIAPCDGDLPVRADPGQLEQLLLHLASNARESMPAKGILTITTQEHRETIGTDEPVSGLAPGRYALLAVTDTGHGFNRAVGERIFEPFFTTHSEDGAAGLGLSTVRGVVKQCGGAIEVDSDPGKGTEFRVYLPRATGSGARAAAGDSQGKTGTLPVRGRVLVVEDEKSILLLVELALHEAGCDVVIASGAPAAIEAFDRDDGRFDLLLTDLVMPDTSGRELAEMLVARRPDLRVIFMTGVPRDPVGARTPAVGGDTEMLRKPFTAEEVVRRVGEALRPAPNAP